MKKLKKNKLKYFVTGGCGFIGSHLVDRLIEEAAVTVYDNLSSGKEAYIRHHYGKNNFRFIKADLLDFKTLQKAIKGSDTVFHIAANPEIRISVISPKIDFEQGIVATYNVLEAMRLRGIKKIVFASSSTVFGDPLIRPTPEDYGPLRPVSVYGASKMACEGLISSYCHMFGMQAWIFRFANIVGRRATHGIIIDLMHKLKKNQDNLEVLGDGKQRKSYLLVEDCRDGMLFAFKKVHNSFNIFNLGTHDDIKVSQIVRILINKLSLKGVNIRYGGGRRGWPGDVPLMLLDATKMKKHGWKASCNSKEAIEKAMDDLIEDEYCRR